MKEKMIDRMNAEKGMAVEETLVRKLNRLHSIAWGMNLEACGISDEKYICRWAVRLFQYQTNLINQFKTDCQKKAFPDTQADGVVFCGKCGKMK